MVFSVTSPFFPIKKPLLRGAQLTNLLSQPLLYRIPTNSSRVFAIACYTKIMSRKMIALIVVVGSLLFYWFQMRPSSIRSSCVQSSIDEARNVVKIRAQMEYPDYAVVEAAKKNLYYNKDYENYYKLCLQRAGL